MCSSDLSGGGEHASEETEDEDGCGVARERTAGDEAGAAGKGSNQEDLATIILRDGSETVASDEEGDREDTDFVREPRVLDHIGYDAQWRGTRERPAEGCQHKERNALEESDARVDTPKSAKRCDLCHLYARFQLNGSAGSHSSN